MSDALIKVAEPAVADKNVDTESLTGAGGATVQRERVQLSGAALAEIARVLNANPASNDYGLAIRAIKQILEAYAILKTDAGVAYDARDRSWTLGASDVPDLSDRAARDVGKIDVASLDQYTPVSGRLPVDAVGTVTANQGAPPWRVVSKEDLAPAAPTFATVGVASAQAVAANGSRKGLLLVNTSNNRVSLGFGAAAVLDSGITLYPMGVFFMEEHDFDTGAVNAIASAAGSNLAIQEYS